MSFQKMDTNRALSGVGREVGREVTMGPQPRRRRRAWTGLGSVGSTSVSSYPVVRAGAQDAGHRLSGSVYWVSLPGDPFSDFNNQQSLRSEWPLQRRGLNTP